MNNNKYDTGQKTNARGGLSGDGGGRDGREI